MKRFSVYKFTSVLYCKSVFLILLIIPGSKQDSNHYVTYHSAGKLKLYSKTEQLKYLTASGVMADI